MKKVKVKTESNKEGETDITTHTFIIMCVCVYKCVLDIYIYISNMKTIAVHLIFGNINVHW